MPTLATSQNLTRLGSTGLLAALGTAVTQYFQGGISAVNWNLLIPVVFISIVSIFAKGQESTGGTVPATPEAAARVASDAPKAPAAAGFVRPGLAFALAVGIAVGLSLGCGTVSALSGSTGPIPITIGKDAAGNAVATSTVSVSTTPAALSGGACLKSIALTFDSLSGQHDACTVMVPLKPVNGACP